MKKIENVIPSQAKALTPWMLRAERSTFTSPSVMNNTFASPTLKLLINVQHLLFVLGAANVISSKTYNSLLFTLSLRADLTAKRLALRGIAL